MDYQKSSSDYDDPVTVHQWCRCGIIMDSNIQDVKYLLEITENGVEENELFSRLLLLKAQGMTIGYKPISPEFQLTYEH